METGRKDTLNLDLVRHSSEAWVAFVPPVSIEDRSLLMGAGRLVMLLSWVPALSGPTD